MSKPDPSDEIWRRAEIDSPCVKICVIHPQERLCVGCLRTLDEIAQWSRMTPEDRRSVMAALPARSGEVSQRRGGRQGRLARAAD